MAAEPLNRDDGARARLPGRLARLAAGLARSLGPSPAAGGGCDCSRRRGHEAAIAVEHGADAAKTESGDGRARAVDRNARRRVRDRAALPPGETDRAGAGDCRPVGERPSDSLLALGCERAVRDAFSRNTRRAVRSDLGIYAEWCAERGRKALPASPQTLAAFIDDMARSRAPATVSRYVASIGAAHWAIGRGKAVKDPLVRLALKRMYRRKGRRQHQVLGLTWAVRERLLEPVGDRLIDERNRALVAVAYDAMLRRSELVSLRVEDLSYEPQGDATLLVRNSKTDGEGRGEMVYLAPDTVALVRSWLARSGVSGGRLFRSVSRSGRLGERLDASQVPRIIKGMAERAGLSPTFVEGLSGHSPRVGAVQDMIAAGIELPAILQAGRWKSAAMVRRYGERLLAREGAAAKLARQQRRE